jgi:hypothetical protein
MFNKVINCEGKSKFKEIRVEAVSVPGGLRLPDIKAIHA